MTPSLQHPAFLSRLHASLPTNQTVYSPLSIHLALSLLSLGLKKNSSSYKEIEVLLHKISHDSNAKILTTLRRFSSNHPEEEFYITCALFPLAGHRLQTRFKRSTKEKYHAECMPLPYDKSPTQCRITINEYVEKETFGEICNVVPQNALDVQTKNVILSTVFLKGVWKEPFNPDFTTKMDFTMLGGKKTQVDMMSARSRTMKFMQYPKGVTGISLPFEAEGLEMLFLKPADASSLGEAEKMLFADSASNAAMKELSLLQIPRFSLKAKLNLKAALSQIGVKDIFNPSNRDFTEMLEGESELCLSNLLHEAVLRVDEEGSTATATTMGSIRALSSKQSESFVLDCPFVCKVTLHGEILFVGRVLDPNMLLDQNRDNH